MTKLGAHVTQGSRTGYGDYVQAKPAVVLAKGEGGALVEANQNGHTITIFRHTAFLDAPHGIDQTNEYGAREMAEYWYPSLKAQWLQNRADYYQITNEGGGNDDQSLKNFVAFEKRILELAENDGYRCCVLNYAAGQPHFHLWKEYSVPLIKRAWQGKHLYGRHVYGLGYNDLVVGGNPTEYAQRLINEILHMRSLNLAGGVVVTECGVDGGFTFEGQRLISQMQQYEMILRNYREVVGICTWTLGDWHGANWQDAIPSFVQYMNSNPTPKWTWPTVENPKPKIVILKKPQIFEMTREENRAANEWAFDNYGRTGTHSIDDMVTMLTAGNTESYAVIVHPTRPSQIKAIEELVRLGLNYIVL
jgi:hypothetical protein